MESGKLYKLCENDKNIIETLKVLLDEWKYRVTNLGL